MSIPHLPPELWIRICTHLDPESRSSLSQVNHAFNKFATDESLFLQHLLPAEVGSTHPAQLYRRLEALHCPPETRTSLFSSARTELLCVVDETLVLCDYERFRLICFPSGLTVDLEENFDSDETFLISYPQLSNPERRHVVLPGGCLGFFYSFNETYFAVLHVATGELDTYPVPGGKLPLKEIVDGKFVVAAGNDAKCIAYYITETKIALVDWQSGELVKEIADIPDGGKCLIGECSGINACTVIGFVSEEKNGTMKEVVARGFDDVEMKFCIEEKKSVRTVLRSADTKTHVMITSLDDDTPMFEEFIACRKESKSEKRWRGVLSMRAFPILRENGRVLISGSGHYSVEQRILSSPYQHLLVELNEDGSTRETVVSTPPLVEALAIWSRRTVHEVWTVIVGKDDYMMEMSRFNIALIKLKQGPGLRVIGMQRWNIKDMISLQVVADHYIVAQNRDGKIKVLHFNCFCDGASGVYACPGMVEDEEEELGGLGEEMSI